MSNWYCVITHPRKEAFVARRLKQQGHETLVPMECAPAADARRSRHMRRRARPTLRRPILPRYVFAALSEPDWGLIGETMFARGFLGIGGEPRALTEKEIDMIRAMESSASSRHRAIREFRRFSAGEIVRVTSGPAQGLKFRVVASNDNPRVATESAAGLRVEFPAEILAAS